MNRHQNDNSCRALRKFVFISATAFALASLNSLGQDSGAKQNAPYKNDSATVAATKEPQVKPNETKDGCVPVGFDLLASYNFDVPDGASTNKTDSADAQIPAKVKAYDKRKVSITGFMLPLKVESGAVTEFLILKDQSMCCYGATPKITEWVSVKTSGKGFKSIMDQAISIQGMLHVGAIRENGYLIGIYSMDAEKLIGPAN